MEREIVRVVRGRHVTDGAGVNICRVIGIPGADYVDPFLMLDDFRNDDPPMFAILLQKYLDF